MFGFPWLHQLFIGDLIPLTKEELFQKAKLIITTTFDKPDDVDYSVIDNYTQQELREMLLKKLFDPSENNNELLRLACRLKYKSIALRLIIDPRVNPFDNDQVLDEIFTFIKINKWNDLLQHLFGKVTNNLQKKMEYCDKYERMVNKYELVGK